MTTAELLKDNQEMKDEILKHCFGESMGPRSRQKVYWCNFCDSFPVGDKKAIIHDPSCIVKKLQV